MIPMYIYFETNNNLAYSINIWVREQRSSQPQLSTHSTSNQVWPPLTVPWVCPSSMCFLPFSLPDRSLTSACSNHNYPLRLSSNATNPLISSISLQPEITNPSNFLWYFLSALTWLLSLTFNYNYFNSQIPFTYIARDKDLSLYYLECLVEANVPVFIKN